MQVWVRVFLSFPVQLCLSFPEKAGKSCYPVCRTLIVYCDFSSQSWYVGPRSTEYEWHFWNTTRGSEFTHFFSPGDIIPSGGYVKPATPAGELKDLLYSGARRFSHSSWGAQSPWNLLGLIPSRIYMEPRLMSCVMLPLTKYHKVIHTQHKSGNKGF